MKTRAIILAGGEGSRLGILTEKRTKPAVPFAGKYRIIDFTLSNCVNSNIFDVMILAQYRPQSLIEHIGIGGPWDLNRDFSGGVRIFTPYKARQETGWFLGTADAIQQNLYYIQDGAPDLITVLSADHIYAMDYEKMIAFHLDHSADVTLATIRVPIEEASRFGNVGIDKEDRVTSFMEKPAHPDSNLVNMGVFVFKPKILYSVVTADHENRASSHDLARDVIPNLINSHARVYAYPYSGYWVDVGTIQSFWQANMDLLKEPPLLNLNNRSWVIHTRTEERGPTRIATGALVQDSLLSDGCIIESGAKVVQSVISPGVIIRSGAVVEESILLTDAEIGTDAQVYKAILDKRVNVGARAVIGKGKEGISNEFVTIGKNAMIPPEIVLQPGATIGTEVTITDFPDMLVKSNEFIKNRRINNEI